MGRNTNVAVRILGALMSLLPCSVTQTLALDGPMGVTRQTKMGSVDPLTYSIHIVAKDIVAKDDGILLKWTKERVPTLEEQLADLKRDPYAGPIPKRWDHKSISFKKLHLARVERAFSKFLEWAEIAAKERIKDQEKVIDDIEPTRRLTLVFAAPAGVLPTMLRVQNGEVDYRWEGFTTDDVIQFQGLLKQLPEMEQELERKMAAAAEKKAKAAEEKARVDKLLK